MRGGVAKGSKTRIAPLLLFGDSHNPIFDIGGEMHASSAGLASQLAFELQIGVDVMGVFGSGATPAREFTEGSGWRAKVPAKR